MEPSAKKRLQRGEEILISAHDKPIARLSAIDEPTDRLAALVAAGLVRPPKSRQRQRPVRRIRAKGSVSDLVADQRR